MHQSSKYTFIINTYPSERREKELKRTLDSIFRQTHQDFVILLVENYKNKKKIEPIVDKFKHKAQKIRVINNPKKKL